MGHHTIDVDIALLFSEILVKNGTKRRMYSLGVLSTNDQLVLMYVVSMWGVGFHPSIPFLVWMLTSFAKYVTGNCWKRRTYLFLGL